MSFPALDGTVESNKSLGFNSFDVENSDFEYTDFARSFF